MAFFSVPREGFHLDTLITWLRQSLLNPYLTSPLCWLILASRMALVPLAAHFSYLTTFLMGCVLMGSLLALNDLFSMCALNSWIGDNAVDWANEIVLITGGSSGIGARVTQKLLNTRPSTKIIVVDFAPLTFPVEEKSSLFYLCCDLSDSDQIANVCQRIKNEIGHPTVLINNAGLTRGASVLEGSYHDVEVTFRSNIIAPFLLIKEFLPHMVERNHGHIVGISSLSAILVPAGLADYAATKAGMICLAEGLRQELRCRHNAPKVRVSTVVLGFVKTPMLKGGSGRRRFLSPRIHVDTAADTIVEVIESWRSQTVWLPAFVRFLAFLRFAPDWLTEGYRNTTQRTKIDFKGRQKIDAETGKLSR